MEALTIIAQLASVAEAPSQAITSGRPLQYLCGAEALPVGGLGLQYWPFGAGLPRSWHGQLSTGPGATGPVAAVGIMPAPEHLPLTGYIVPLPERMTGRIVTVSS